MACDSSSCTVCAVASWRQEHAQRGEHCSTHLQAIFRVPEEGSQQAGDTGEKACTCTPFVVTSQHEADFVHSVPSSRDLTCEDGVDDSCVSPHCMESTGADTPRTSAALPMSKCASSGQLTETAARQALSATASQNRNTGPSTCSQRFGHPISSSAASQTYLTQICMRRIRSDSNLADATSLYGKTQGGDVSPLTSRASACNGGSMSSSQCARPCGPDWICALEFHAWEPALLAANVRKSVDLYDIRGQGEASEHSKWLEGPCTVFSAPAKLACAEWCPWASSVVLTGDYDGVLYGLDVTTGHILAEVDEHSGHRVYSACHSRLRRHVVASAGDDGGIRLWGGADMSSPCGYLRGAAPVCTLAFSSTDENVVVAGDTGGRIALWDLRQTTEPVVKWQAHLRPCSHVALHGRHVVSTGTDSVLRVWEPRPELAQSAPESRLGASLPSVECLEQLQGHTSARNFVGMSVRQDGVVACGSECGAVHVYRSGATWRSTCERALVCPQGCVTAVAWGEAGLGKGVESLLAAGCSDGSVHVMPAH